MAVSTVWGRGGEATRRTLFDPMRSSGQTIWKFQQEVSFFSLARCFIGEKYELRDEKGGGLVKTLLFPRHRVFVIDGRDPGGGGGGEGGFQILASCSSCVIVLFQFRADSDSTQTVQLPLSKNPS